MPNYTSRVEKDIWGNDRVVTRETVSGADIVDFGSAVIRGFQQRRADANIDLAIRQLQWAMEASDHRNYQGAIAVINEVIKKFPNDAEPYIARAKVNFEHSKIAQGMGRLSDSDRMLPAAIADLNVAINLGGDNLDAYVIRGFAYLEGGALDYAMADANICVKMAPNDAVGHLLKCSVFLELEDYEQALMSAQRSLQVETTSSGYLGRGRAYYEMGDYQKALPDFTRAIALDSTDKNGYRLRAQTYQKLGREEEANDDLRTAFPQQPANAEPAVDSDLRSSPLPDEAERQDALDRANRKRLEDRERTRRMFRI